MMNFRIRMALESIGSAFEFVSEYKKNNNPLFLLSAGAHSKEAFCHIYEAKNFVPEEELKVWEEIYWEFYRDLNLYVLE